MQGVWGLWDLAEKDANVIREAGNQSTSRSQRTLSKLLAENLGRTISRENKEGSVVHLVAGREVRGDGIEVAGSVAAVDDSSVALSWSVELKPPATVMHILSARFLRSRWYDNYRSQRVHYKLRKRIVCLIGVAHPSMWI